MVTEVNTSKTGREKSGELTPEHSAPGVVLFKQFVQPVKLRLRELCVVYQPGLVFW